VGSIWREGYRYATAGVTLQDLAEESVVQHDLLSGAAAAGAEGATKRLMDAINAKLDSKVWLAGQGVNHRWQMSREHLLPRYTTAWEELPLAR